MTTSRNFLFVLLLLLSACAVTEVRESTILWIAEEDAYYYTNEYAGNQYVTTELRRKGSDHLIRRTCIFAPNVNLTEGETRNVKYLEELNNVHKDELYLCE